MSNRTLPAPRFHPGDAARFKHAPDIECYIESVTWTDVGGCHYMAVWWADGSRCEAGGISDNELEPPAGPPRGIAL